jgi:hypothetical protein
MRSFRSALHTKFAASTHPVLIPTSTAGCSFPLKSTEPFHAQSERKLCLRPTLLVPQLCITSALQVIYTHPTLAENQPHNSHREEDEAVHFARQERWFTLDICEQWCSYCLPVLFFSNNLGTRWDPFLPNLRWKPGILETSYIEVEAPIPNQPHPQPVLLPISTQLIYWYDHAFHLSMYLSNSLCYFVLHYSNPFS